MLAKPFSKGWRRSAVHIIVAAAMPAACWPVPVAAARKARSSRLVASDTASGAGGTDPLWRAMPFIREGRFQRVPAVWFYGATLSAMHFARVLADAQGGPA